MSNVSKGNYYAKKTADWYRAEGWIVEPIEVSKSIWINGKVIYQKYDVFASDLLAMNGTDIMFIQCKTHKSDVSKAIKEFHKYPFPPFVKRIVVRWEPRSKEPTVIEV